MTVKEFYEAISGNYQEASSRLMKDSMIIRFVRKFPADNSFSGLKESLEAGDTETAFRCAHTLKGVSANLAFSKLTESSSTITEMLRAGELENAKNYFPAVAEDYELVISLIDKIEEA